MYVLEVHDLRARYGDHEVLRGVSLQVSRGQWFCLLGPNGVGKSTLLHCIAGRLQPASGDVRINGCSLPVAPAAGEAQPRLCMRAGPVARAAHGRQCLEVYAIAKELERIDADVLALADELRFTQFIDGFVDTYSLGTRQKLCVLLALLGDPALIVLHEAQPRAGPRSTLALKLHLRERLVDGRCGVLLATHSLDIVEHHADAAALLLDGVIAKRWTADEIKQLRLSGEDGFEGALAAASV